MQDVNAFDYYEKIKDRDLDKEIETINNIIYYLKHYELSVKQIVLTITDKENDNVVYNETPKLLSEIVFYNFIAFWGYSSEIAQDVLDYLKDFGVIKMNEEKTQILQFILDKVLNNTCKELKIAKNDEKYDFAFNINWGRTIFTNNGKLFTKETLRKKINEIINDCERIRNNLTIINAFKNNFEQNKENHNKKVKN